MKTKFLQRVLWLMIPLLTVFSTNAWGYTDIAYSFNTAIDNPGNGVTWTTDYIDSYSYWTATKGGSYNPAFYTDGKGLRVYNGGSFTITSTKTIASITLTFSGTSYTFSSSNTTNPQTVTPNATSYNWSVSRTCRLQKIEITYAGGGTISGDYVRLDNASDLHIGDKIIIANTGHSQAISTTQNSNNRGQASVTESSATININSESSSVQVFAVNEGGTSSNTYWEFYAINGSSQGYIYAASSSSNYLRTQSPNDANGTWTVAVNGSKESTITAKGGNTHNVLKYNTNLFSCYSSGQTAVKIYKLTQSCTKIGAPTVTATPGDGQIALSWANQAEATSYTVSCTGGSVGSVTGTTTKSCTITGLTNGTSYTWTVTPVGDGSTYCESGNTAASASATPNVSRTITYYDKDGSHTTSLADGTNIATALTALYGGDDPVSCDATNYEYFVGWRVGAINGSTTTPSLLTTETVSSSSPSNNYYAVWSDTDPEAAGGWTQTTSVAAGDKVVIAQIDDGTTELTGFNTTITTDNNYGTYDDFTTNPAGTMVWTVEAGNSDGQFSFKNGSYYLNLASNNNYLSGKTTKDANSSWTVTTSNSRAKVTNASQTSRSIMWNKSSPRFASYAKNHGDNSGSYYYYVIFYKQTSVGTPEYITTCCDKHVTLTATVSPAASGTVVFSPAGPIATCSATEADRQTTMTITPNAGYKLTSWSTTGVTPASVSPAVATSGDDSKSAQAITVTFTQNTTTGTYTANATFTAMVDHYIDKLHADINTLYDGDGKAFNTAGYSVPSLSNGGDPADDSCAEAHYKFVGWIDEAYVDTDGTLTDASKMFTATGTKNPSDTNFIAVWAKEK